MRGLVAGILASMLSTPGFGSPLSLQNHRLESKRPAPSRSHLSSLWLVHHQRFSSLEGKQVENRDGQELGRLQDTVLDLNHGKVQYVVISFGGWWGIGKSLRAVPAQLASTATAKFGVVSLNTGLRRWERAPLFKPSDLVYLSSHPVAAQSLDHYYLQPVRTHRGTVTNQPAPTQTESPAPLPPTGRQTNGTLRLTSARSLMGAKLFNQAGQNVGKVADILIDFSGQMPAFLIINDENRLSGSDHVALPLGEVKLLHAGVLAAEVTRENFSRAPLLDDARWKSTATDEPLILYRFKVSKNPASPGTNHLTGDSRVAAAEPRS